MNKNQHGRSRSRMAAWGVAGALALAPLNPVRASDLAPPEFASGLRATVAQAGHFNQALVEQRDMAQFAELVQEGINNRLQTLQAGQQNFLFARQLGSDNMAAVTQSGAHNRVELDQQGVANRASVEQIGSGHHALIEQFGNGNRADIVQGINAPNVVVRQYGDHIVTSLIQY